IVNIDGRGRVRCCNPAFEELFLYAAAEVRGRSLERLVGAARASEAAVALRELARGRDGHAMMQIERKDRSVVEVEFFGAADGAAPRDDHWAIFQNVSAPESPVSRVTRSLIGLQEEERLRVARALHDDVGQRLAVAQLSIDRMLATIGQPRRDQAGQLA